MRAVNSTMWMKCKNMEGKPCKVTKCYSTIDEQKCRASTYVLEKINNTLNSSIITDTDWVLLRLSSDTSSFILCERNSVCKYTNRTCGMPGQFDAQTCKDKILKVQVQTVPGNITNSPTVILQFLEDDRTSWLGCNRERKKKCKRFTCHSEAITRQWGIKVPQSLGLGRVLHAIRRHFPETLDPKP